MTVIGVLLWAGTMRLPLSESGHDSTPEVEVLEQRYRSLSWKKIWTSGVEVVPRSAEYMSGIVAAEMAVLRIGGEALPPWVGLVGEDGFDVGELNTLFSKLF